MGAPLFKVDDQGFRGYMFTNGESTDDIVGNNAAPLDTVNIFPVADWRPVCWFWIFLTDLYQ